MGAQFCKDTQRNQQNELRQLSSKQKTILNCCYTPPVRSSKFKDQQIAPIQFSDLGTPDNTPDKNKIQKENSSNTNVSASHPNLIATLDHQSDQKNKQWKTAVNTEQKEYFNEKKDLQTVIKSPNLKQINVQLVQFESMSVPFSVIRLIMKPEFLKLIKLVDRDFDKAHGDHKCDTFHKWKLHNKGYYFNKLSNGDSIIVTDKYFYQGKLVDDCCKADGKGGILIDQYGAYHGEFKQGLAHGNGSYLSVNGKKKYQGLWRQGSLEKGIIQTDVYKYEGELKKNVPEGKGILHIFSKKITYKGPFVKGKYEGSMAQYQCELYRYKGGFKNGKKDGQGELIEKQRLANREQSTLKFKAPRKFRGTFKEDVITLKEGYK